ncbi:MAG: helix-hairpin-helix domain-containing protein [Chitinophagaceae bacterium]
MLFYFNPNTLSEEGWKKLGIREKTIHTIKNYLTKGGVFKNAEDLRKIYGLSETEYHRISPFIKIENENKIEEPEPSKTEEKSYTARKSITPSVVELNSTDTTALIALPGIGSKLAARIINFRDKLGGFYSVDQLKETYGIADSVFQKIKPYLKVNEASIKRININSITLDELKTHPYIKYNIAKTIIGYRNEHGQFSKMDDLKKIMTITDEVYTKITPYLTLQ